MIKYIQLPVHFDVQPMLDEISRLPGMNWKMHYNKKHYEGDWSVIALRSPGGDSDNIYAIHATAGEKQYKNTELLAHCPAISEVLCYFKCEITMTRLMKLDAGAVIKQHTDHDMNFESGEARFHVPLQTNDDVSFFVEEERVPMKEGECWYLNLNLPHRVTNAGATDRIHLVIDCMVNDWIKEQFDLPGIVKKEVETKNIKYTNETRSRIIESLRLMNTSVSIEMARKLEEENEN